MEADLYKQGVHRSGSADTRHGKSPKALQSNKAERPAAAKCLLLDPAAQDVSQCLPSKADALCMQCYSI